MSWQPYQGPRQKLVIALDLGTTFSGVSYSILDPGIVPEIKGVTRFPAQENAGGDAKIPTILYYDQSGDLKAAGAEALDESVIRSAEDEGWVKYSRFKLHLRPKWAHTKEINEAILPLPPGKDIIEVFGDFYAYLVDCTLTFIQESHQNGTDLLSSVQDRIEFILSHPNGWEGVQQKKLRRAAVYAGLIPDNDQGHEKIHFVTEGEASLHFCIDHGLSSYIRDGEGVLIVDAGGGTVDISTYSRTSSSSTDGSSFEEIVAPACIFAGSTFVTRRAELFLKKKLKGSQYEGEVELIADCFDKTTKHRFRNANEPAYIKFGTMRDTDPRLDIRSGQLKLSGSEVASFFEPSVSSIIRGIDNQRSHARKFVSSIFLVGGFAANTWLFLKMRQQVEPSGLSFSRPDSHVNKAVADGAVSFYIYNIVSARVSKYNYGTRVHTRFNPSDPEHARRKSQIYILPNGEEALAGQYNIILPKACNFLLQKCHTTNSLEQDSRVLDTQEFRASYNHFFQSPSAANSIRVGILCYHGQRPDPLWMDREPDNYPVLFTITANTSIAAKVLEALPRKGGGIYYCFNYDIVIFVGRTELKAQICWKENGAEKRGPAQIVYDRDL